MDDMSKTIHHTFEIGDTTLEVGSPFRLHNKSTYLIFQAHVIDEDRESEWVECYGIGMGVGQCGSRTVDPAEVRPAATTPKERRKLEAALRAWNELRPAMVPRGHKVGRR